MGNQNLDKLREICDHLGPRDEEIKKNEQILKSILFGIPIKITACIINSEMKIIKLLSNDSGKECIRTPTEFRSMSISEYFSCKKNIEEAMKAHAFAMQGRVTDYITNIKNQAYNMRCAPVHDEHGEVVGSSIVSWESRDN
jgi:hypothetical protein